LKLFLLCCVVTTLSGCALFKTPEEVCASNKNPQACANEVRAERNCHRNAKSQTMYKPDSLVCTGSVNAEATNKNLSKNESANCFKAGYNDYDKVRYGQLMTSCMKQAGYKWQP
jgi:hypothetical protein